MQHATRLVLKAQKISYKETVEILKQEMNEPRGADEEELQDEIQDENEQV